MVYEDHLVKKFKNECNPGDENTIRQLDDETIRVDYGSGEALYPWEVKNVEETGNWEIARNENGVAIVKRKRAKTDNSPDTLATTIEETIAEWSEENLEDHQSVRKVRYWRGEATVDIHEDPDSLVELRENLPDFAEIDENKFLVRPGEVAIEIGDTLFKADAYRAIAESDYAVSNHDDTHIMVRPEEKLLQ